MINKQLVQFQSGDFSLTGQWDGPNGVPVDTRLPAVLFGHGFTGNRFESRRMYTMLSARLVKHDIRTFRFDHRGCGDSEGDFSDFSPEGYFEDLDAALSEFLGYSGVDLDRIALVGYSLGGMSASYWLDKYRNWRTGALWAPVARPDIIRDRLATYPDFENYKVKGHFDYMGFRVSAAYIDGVGKYNPVEWACNFAKPLLFVQGAEDMVVKPEQVHRYLAARANDGDKLLMVPGGDHAFTTADNIAQVLETTENWLVSCL